MSKARIVVDGVVQGVGYRALVKQVARHLGLKGLVRNLKDTRVEVFCEGHHEKIEEFVKKIDRKAKAEDFLSINVSEVRCFFEGERQFQPAWKQYRDFEIDYGADELSAFDEATLEDHEFSKLYFIGFRDELKDFSIATDRNFKGLAGKYGDMSTNLKGFSQTTDRNFKEMAEKYGDISIELKEFRKAVQGFLEAFLAEYQKKATSP